MECQLPLHGMHGGPRAVSGTADAAPTCRPLPPWPEGHWSWTEQPESPGRVRGQLRAPRGLAPRFPPRRPGPGSSAQEGLEGPSSAAGLFVVPVVTRNRREILSPAGTAGGRHLKRHRLGAAVIAVIGRRFVRLLGGTGKCSRAAGAQGFRENPGGLWAPGSTHRIAVISFCLQQAPCWSDGRPGFPLVPPHRLPHLSYLRRQNSSPAHKSSHWTHIS